MGSIRRSGGDFESAATSARLSSRPVVSAEHWSGASKTLVDISRDLDGESSLDVFRQERDARKIRLRSTAERFENFSLRHSDYPSWTCNEHDAQLINVAAKCCKAVYLDSNVPEIPRHFCKQVHSVSPSSDGTVKACKIYMVERLTLYGVVSTIVVAVRGSASFVDWVVNANSDPSDASSFVNYETLHHVSGYEVPKGAKVQVHRGFLSCSRELIPRISREFANVLREYPGSVDIIFTGHSAGGAVASLLYAHFLSNAFGEYDYLNTPNVRLSSITFGAPPIFSQDLTPLVQQIPDGLIGKGITAALIADGDPIPRMDSAYAKELINLVLLCNSGNSNGSASGTYKLPSRDVHLFGEPVIIQDVNCDGDEVDLRAFAVESKAFDKVLFANFFAHSMDSYLGLAAQIAEGRFNGRNDWLNS